MAGQILQEDVPQSEPRITRMCQYCQAVLEPGDPGAPVSHGIGPCCWDHALKINGLPPRPYPTRSAA
jgi:hypothetical protein